MKFLVGGCSLGTGGVLEVMRARAGVCVWGEGLAVGGFQKQEVQGSGEGEGEGNWGWGNKCIVDRGPRITGKEIPGRSGWEKWVGGDSGGEGEFVEAQKTRYNWRSGSKNGHLGSGTMRSRDNWNGNTGRMKECWALKLDR